MKTGWVTKRLGEVCDYYRGLTYSKQDEVAFSRNVVLRANNISLGTSSLNLDELKYIRDDFEIPDDKKIKRDSILICAASGSKEHLGKVALINVDYPYAFGGFMGLLVPCEEILPQYLFRLLTSNAYRLFITGLTDGTNINNLKFSQLSEFEFILPPLAEQKRIVAKIDAAFEKIDKLKANAERNLANTKELFQSALNEAMRPKPGWVEKRLNDIFNFIDYRGKTPTKLTSGIPLITAKNIRMGYLDYSCKDYISQDEFETRQSRGVARKGDILFTTEAPLGFVAMADLDTFSTGQRVITFQQYSNRTDEIENRFYYFYFQSRFFQDEVRRLATGATAQGIKASRLKEINVPLPPLAEQRSCVSVLDRMMEGTVGLQSNYTRLMADCAEMRQAVLKEAFEGRL